MPSFFRQHHKINALGKFCEIFRFPEPFIKTNSLNFCIKVFVDTIHRINGCFFICYPDSHYPAVENETGVVLTDQYPVAKLDRGR